MKTSYQAGGDAPKKVRLRVLNQNVAQLYRALDDQHRRMYEREQISCHAGCSACCSMYVDCTGAEAVRIVARFPAVVREVRAELERQARLLDQDLEAEGITSDLRLDIPDECIARVVGRWWQRRERCAFLGADERCRIYDARPLMCRTHHVQSDPAACADPTGKAEVIKVKLVELEQQVALLLGRAEQDLLDRVTMAPLQHAVLAAAAELECSNKDDAETACARQWCDNGQCAGSTGEAADES